MQQHFARRICSKLEDYILEAVKIRSKNLNFIIKLRERLKEKYDLAVTSPAIVNAIRDEPVCVYLYGQPGVAKPNDMVITTIVTSEMINQVAKQNQVNCYNVLTGFKWIAELIKEKEGKENYIIGGEESFGLMIGDQIRDKDAVSEDIVTGKQIGRAHV